MISKPNMLLVLPLAAAFFAGCGGSSKTQSTATTSATNTTTTVATSSTPTSSTPTSSTPTTSTPATTPSTSSTTNALLEREIASCKQAIQTQNLLPASSKRKLEGYCSAAAKGESAAILKAAKEVCAEVEKNAPLPAGPAREQALRECQTIAGKS